MVAKWITEHKDSSHHIQEVSIGDQVVMTGRYKIGNDIVGLIWTVVEGPRYFNGKRRVRLEGYEDWYPVDGLKIVG